MRDLRKESSRKNDMMSKKALYDAIERYADDYRSAYPRSAESDLKLVSAYCSGSSAAHVALDNHCAECTVYRAINRVRQFIRLQEIDDHWKPLIDHIMEHSPNFGDCDAQGILDMLYEIYCEYNYFEDASTKMGFEELYRLLEDLPVGEIDPLIYVVCDLCRNHQRTGFTEGIRVGIRLGEELRD